VERAIVRISFQHWRDMLNHLVVFVSVGHGNPQMVLIWVQSLGDLSFFPALI
jgi:hypothetical protein